MRLRSERNNGDEIRQTDAPDAIIPNRVHKPVISAKEVFQLLCARLQPISRAGDKPPRYTRSIKQETRNRLGTHRMVGRPTVEVLGRRGGQFRAGVLPHLGPRCGIAEF